MVLCFLEGSEVWFWVLEVLGGSTCWKKGRICWTCDVPFCVVVSWI